MNINIISFMELTQGLESVGYIYAAFAITYVANIILGVTKNCLMEGQHFEFKRILISICKVVLAGFVTFVVTLGFNMLQTGADIYGLDLSENVLATVNIGVFLALFAASFVQTCTDIYNKIKCMFDVSEVKEQHADVAGINDALLEQVYPIYQKDFEPEEIMAAQEEYYEENNLDEIKLGDECLENNDYVEEVLNDDGNDCDDDNEGRG